MGLEVILDPSPSASEEFPQFELCGGHLALDFANTLSQRNAPALATDHLTSYGRLVAFAEQTQVLSPAQARRFRTHERSQPMVTQRVLAEAIELREALHRLFGAVAGGDTPDDWSLAVLNDRMARLRLGGQLTWEWQAGPSAPDAFVAAIVRAAVDLLVTPERERVRFCASDACLWLFLDTSKNGSRRWCDMRQCGNRMKARRFQQRHQGK